MLRLICLPTIPENPGFLLKPILPNRNLKTEEIKGSLEGTLIGFEDKNLLWASILTFIILHFSQQEMMQ